MNCPRCDGRGWNSDSTTLAKRRCNTCGGTGDVDVCTQCDGDGKVLHSSTLVRVTCDRCNGRGWVGRR